MQKASKKSVLPFSITAASVIGFVLLWQYQYQRENNFLKLRVHDEAEKIKIEVSETLRETSLAMQRFAARVEHLGTRDKIYLKLDSGLYLEQLPILDKIGIVDRDLKLVWSYPDPSINASNKSESVKDASVIEAFLNSKRSKKPSFSRAIDLGSFGMGFILPVPLFKNEEFTGFVYATVKAQKLFHSFIPTNDFQVLIRENEKILFQSPSVGDLEKSWIESETVLWGQSSWTVEVIPSEKFLHEGRSILPNFLLIFGLFMSALLGILLKNIFSSRREALMNTVKLKVLSLRLGFALDSAKMAAWNLNLETQEVWRSENHDQIYGYLTNIKDWSQETFLNHVTAHDRIRVGEELKKAFIEKFTSIEFQIIRSDDKTLRWLNVMSHLTFDEKGKPQQLFGIVRDITTEKIETIEKQNSSQMRKAIIESSNYAIISTDAHGIIKTFNQAAATMLGYSAEELLDQANIDQFFLETEFTSRAKNLTRELKRKVGPGMDALTAKVNALRVADENEWTLKNKDGRLFPANLSLTALLDEKGEISGYLGIAVDLTEKKKTQDRLGRLIKATGEGIWEREYIPGGKISYMDEQAKSIFGFSEYEEEPLYDAVASNIIEADRPKVAEALNAHFHSDTAGFVVEFRMRTHPHANTTRWIRARGQIINKKDKVPLLVSTVQDVTEQVDRSEQLKIALANAESATQAKSDFLANMSHEIRTPLNGVIGMTSLLLGTNLSHLQKDYADMIKSSAEILLVLVNDILDFSKIEARKLDLENIEFDIAKVASDAERLLNFSAQKKKIRLTHFLSEDLPTTKCKGDPNRINQILTNLISNAIKFTERGEVHVNISHDPQYRGEQRLALYVEVSDTGIGMNQAAVARMFQPFSQGDTSTTRKYGGTGLGLSICKHLVEMMGGTIGVRSEVGAGSTFWFTLILEKADGTVTAMPTHQLTVLEKSPSTRPLRILLAEDNRVNQIIAVAMLEDNEYQVEVVSNGLEALSALAVSNFDLVLMDCQMPELDGYNATKEIRRQTQQAYSNIPIIAMTANAMSGDREKCLASGMNDYVTKPIDAKELRLVMDRVLKNHSVSETVKLSSLSGLA